MSDDDSALSRLGSLLRLLTTSREEDDMQSPREKSGRNESIRFAKRSTLDRRTFLTRSAAATLIFAAHDGVTQAAPWRSLKSKDAGARLLSLRLHTSVPLAELKQFYHDALEMKVEFENANSIAFMAGSTRLTFELVDSQDEPAPLYHFAFNIPENKILEAREWQLQHTTLIDPFDHLRDPNMPDDVVHFRHWNAHSVYFFDPAGNVVEYIARHTLDNASNEPFSASDILYASEIGVASDEVDKLQHNICEAFQVSPYGRTSDQFAALGDENGLIILMRTGRPVAFGLGSPIAPCFSRIEIKGDSDLSRQYSDSLHEIIQRSANGEQ